MEIWRERESEEEKKSFQASLSTHTLYLSFYPSGVKDLQA
jgi:hypothetical protein